jgi:hypothetical protein
MSSSTETRNGALLVSALVLDAVAVGVAGVVHAWFRVQVWDGVDWTLGRCGSWSPLALLPFVAITGTAVGLAAAAGPRSEPWTRRGLGIWITVVVFAAAILFLGMFLLLITGCIND